MKGIVPFYLIYSVIFILLHNFLRNIHIMVLHFLAFKIVDVVYGKMMGIHEKIYSQFPKAFDMYILYWVAGIIFPLITVASLKKTKGYIQFLIKKEKESERKVDK